MSALNQQQLCNSMDQIDPLSIGNTVNGWDINDLAFQKDSFSQGTCNQSGGCADTVTVADRCYKAEEVNYYLYGYMRSMCGKGRYTTQMKISSYRTPLRMWLWSSGTRGRICFATHGWNDGQWCGISHSELSFVNLRHGHCGGIKGCSPCAELWRGTFTVSIGAPNSYRMQTNFNCQSNTPGAWLFLRGGHPWVPGREEEPTDEWWDDVWVGGGVPTGPF
jgi:hypothetical protein